MQEQRDNGAAVFDSISGDVSFLPDVAKIPPAATRKSAEIVQKESCQVSAKLRNAKKGKYSLRLCA